MTFRILSFLVLPALVLITGCEKKVPEAPPTSGAAKPAARVALPPPTPEAVIERLTEGKDPDVIRHKIDDRTEFPQSLVSLAPNVKAPQTSPTVAPAQQTDLGRAPVKGLTADGTTAELIEKDWTGIVLVPVDNSKISRAHTIRVSLDRIETHPLLSGQVRIWARIQNIDGADLPAEVACSFRTAENLNPDRPRFYKLNIPHNGSSDVFFVSPEGMNLNAYTVLVRADNMTWSGSFKK